MKKPISRRRFFTIACAAAAAAICPLVSAPLALARAMSIKEHIRERIIAAYREDAASTERFPQDNIQHCQMRKLFLEQAMDEDALLLMRTQWTDRSSGIKSLRASGSYPSPRASRFRRLPYPHDTE